MRTSRSLTPARIPAMLIAAFLTLLAPLPGRAWFHSCGSLAIGGDGYEGSGNPAEWSNRYGDLRLYTHADGNSVVVSRTTVSGLHSMVEKGRLSPTSWNGSSTGAFNATSTVRMKVLPPVNPSRSNAGVINFICQIMERDTSANGYPQCFAFIHEPGARKLGYRVRGPVGNGGAMIERRGLVTVNPNDTIELRIEGRFTRATDGWIRASVKVNDGPMTQIGYHSGIRTIVGATSWKTFLNTGCYAYGTNIDTGLDVDFVWIPAIY